MLYIEKNRDELQKVINGRFAKEQKVWSRSYGEFHVNDLNFEDVKSVDEILHNTAIAIQRARVA